MTQSSPMMDGGGWLMVVGGAVWVLVIVALVPMPTKTPARGEGSFRRSDVC